MQRIVIFGAAGHAKVILDAARLQGEYEVLGLVDRPGSTVPALACPVIATDDDMPRLLKHVHSGVVAIGDNWARAKLVESIKSVAPDFQFVRVIHPSAVVAQDASVGEGSVVMAGAVINPGSHIGRHCIINTNASVDHDNEIGDFASLAPGATTGGHVKVGSFAAVGLNAAIIQRISIGEHTVIGAGATVLQDVPDHVVSFGTPARVVRTRRPGDNYL